MQVIPDTEQRQIQFCHSHVQTWAAAAPEIGLTDAMVAELAALTAEADAALGAAYAARLASTAATAAFKDTTRRMREKAATLVRLIKAHAATAPQPGLVYGAAQISEPAAPAPLPAPGRPESITAELNPGGAITLRWHARNGAPTSGAVYEVSRGITGVDGGYASIGFGISTGQGRFECVDHTLPAGVSSASYIVTGRRGTRTGEPSVAIMVQFGTGSIVSADGGAAHVRLAA